MWGVCFLWMPSKVSFFPLIFGSFMIVTLIEKLNGLTLNEFHVTGYPYCFQIWEIFDHYFF